MPAQEQHNIIKPKGRKLITSKSVFTITLIVIPLTFLSVWLFGLGQHRTIFENSLLSTTILSSAFMLFLTIGLYNGIKLKDDLGKIVDKKSDNNLPNKLDALSQFEFPNELPSDGDGIEGIILGIIVWLIFTIFVLIFIWFLGILFWPIILVFAAMLYWIFFRALRLVFKNANRCKGNLVMSLTYAIAYTTLYNFWIYGIILATHYLI